MTKKTPLPSQEVLWQLLEYDCETGIFRWKRRNDLCPRASGWNTKYAGNVAGRTNPDGYHQIVIDGVPLYSHRLAWVYVHGVVPPEHIDHTNGNPGDNRINNLRPATQTQNMRNTRSRPKKFGLPKGVSIRCDGKKYCAYIKADGVHRNLGSFNTPEEAHAVYVAAAKEHFGEFARAA